MENKEELEKWYESKLGFLAIVFFPILTGTVIVCLYIASIQTSIAVQAQEFVDFKNNDITHIELEIAQETQAEEDTNTQVQKLNDKIVQDTTLLNTILANKK